MSDTDIKHVEQEDVLSQYVNFTLGDETFAVTMNSVEEIIRFPQTFRVPLTPDYLVGLANLRGVVLPVLCLRRMLNLPPAEVTESTRVVVMMFGGVKTGFTVDKVLNVSTPEPSSIKPTNTAGGQIDEDLITETIHQEGQIIQVLDTTQLISPQMASEIEHTAQNFSQSVSHLAQVDQDDDAQMRQLVCCLIEEQEYAFPLEDTQEIVRIPSAITRVPKTDPSMLGIMNLRGRTLALISLRTLFNMEQGPFDESNRVLVVNLRVSASDVVSVGVVVDSVKEVIRLHESQLDEVPSLMNQLGSTSDISAICNLENGKRTLSIVEVSQLFDDSLVQEVSQQSQSDQESVTVSDLDTNQDDFDDESTDCQLVIFKLGNEQFGISIHAVQEIIRIPDDINKVPKTDAFIEGVINLRGNVLPVVDMRLRFSLESMERHDRQRILVVHFDRVSTGFIVDSVSEVLRIPESQMESAPPLSEEQASLMKQVVNFEDRMIGVLTADQLISNTEMYKLYMAANEVAV
jgi:purine-binding chemotaxis protein CheW